MTKKKVDFSQSVYEHIDKNNLQIRPKIWFVLSNILVSMGAIGLILVGTFIFNLIISYFTSLGRQDCLCWQVMADDFPGNLPIIPMIVTLFCLVVGIYLLRKFRAVYSHSLWKIIVFVLSVSIILAIILVKSGLSDQLMVTPVLRDHCPFGLCPYEMGQSGHSCPNANQEYLTCG
ncbi:MAG: hypothetical protein LBG64_04385 [Pseudomonadales bacterium]|jgi:hypothetical protein|nr:hypothetical protein [Pseudomonadales bacterium]